MIVLCCFWCRRRRRCSDDIYLYMLVYTSQYDMHLYCTHVYLLTVTLVYICISYIGVGCNKRLQSMMGDMVRERGASLCAMDYRLV